LGAIMGDLIQEAGVATKKNNKPTRDFNAQFN